MTNHKRHFPTILLIDTTEKDCTRLALLEEKQTSTLEEPVRAQELQKLIVALLDKTANKLEGIKAIAVLTGPGSFTGTRIGITAANTLHWVYKMPLIPIRDLNFAEALDQLEQGQDFPATNQIKPLD